MRLCAVVGNIRSGGGRYSKETSLLVCCVRLRGILTGWAFANVGDKLKILTILRWGCLKGLNTGTMFTGCSNLTLLTVDDVFDTTGITSLRFMFFGCSALTNVNNLNMWDVSNINDFYVMFRNCTNFNTYVNDWDVTSAIGGVNLGLGLHGLFYSCTNFNQPLNKWDVSNCKEFNTMFAFATSFNQDISMWDMRSAEDLQDFMLGKVTANYSLANMDAIYDKWSKLPLQSTVNCSFGDIDYTAFGAIGRNILASTFNWSIVSGNEV
jgi:surface protein